jgi:thiamine biosynthesis lipoprotein ApbE
MKILLVVLFLLPNLYGDSLQDKIDKLIPHLIAVESGGDLRAIGDNGKAKGQLQIWNINVMDVNRIYKTSYVHDDAFSYYKSIEMCVRYLTYWGNYAKTKKGVEPTLESLARQWNGGPNGFKRNATVSYWKKVKKSLSTKNK